jgi:hypothetical protein
MQQRCGRASRRNKSVWPAANLAGPQDVGFRRKVAPCGKQAFDEDEICRLKRPEHRHAAHRTPIAEIPER